MKIVFKDTFFERLRKRVDYLARNSPQQARLFKTNLFLEIRKAAKKPYQCRKSIYFDEECMRDIVYKGHTITFEITTNTIEVIGLKYYQNTPFDIE